MQDSEKVASTGFRRRGATVGGGVGAQQTIPRKKPRTSEDFQLFCQIILEHENYFEIKKQEEMRAKTSSPLGSTGSREDSVKSEPSSVADAKNSDVETDDESYDLVTCYCRKPFARRPMIECSQCLTWIHLSCAKIRRTNIPEVFICVRCKGSPSNGMIKSEGEKQEDEDPDPIGGSANRAKVLRRTVDSTAFLSSPAFSLQPRRSNGSVKVRKRSYSTSDGGSG